MSRKKTTASPSRAPASPPAAAPSAPLERDAPSHSCLRLGWAMVTLFLALGLVLESFHLVKLPFYLDVRLRRELWTLAHAHGTLLGAVNVLFGLSATRLVARFDRRLLISRLLRAGTLLVPIGFLLGGIGQSEGDPSFFILLVPTGALLALLGLGIMLSSGRP